MSAPIRRPRRWFPECAASALVAALTALPSTAFQDCSFATVPGVRTLHQPDGAPVGQTPTVTGTYTFTVRASDPSGFYDQRELTLEVVSRTRRRTL